jgi:hypothetical protein
MALPATTGGLIQERRTALISAVTGKIDVRGWKAPAPVSREEVV